MLKNRPCGHPESLLLKSAETGEPLYCEACDDKSGRRDAEARETELTVANQVLRKRIEDLLDYDRLFSIIRGTGYVTRGQADEIVELLRAQSPTQPADPTASGA